MVARAVAAVMFVFGVLLASLTVGPSAEAGRVKINAAGGYFTVPVISLKEARFQTVIKQQYDFSCGAAAVATLLTFHYDRPTGEKEVFIAMWNGGDKERIQKQGFSLLDMKDYLTSQGYRADGYRVPLDKLVDAGVPAIVLINTKGYKHFVVIKGVQGDEVLVGDPALGMKVYPRAAFEAAWNGVIFTVRSDAAQTHFNEDRDWRVRVKAPFGTALSREGLAMFTLTLPARNEF